MAILSFGAPPLDKGGRTLRQVRRAPWHRGHGFLHILLGVGLEGGRWSKGHKGAQATSLRVPLEDLSLDVLEVLLLRNLLASEEVATQRIGTPQKAQTHVKPSWNTVKALLGGSGWLAGSWARCGPSH